MVVLLDYSSVQFVRSVALSLCEVFECVVDTDFGVVLSGIEFKDRVTAAPEWDWRKESETLHG